MKFSIASPTGIIIAGHRGNPAQFPENTMLSFCSAVSLGVDMIETDIHLARDGVPVLMHDANIGGKTAGNPDHRNIKTLRHSRHPHRHFAVDRLAIDTPFAGDH